MVGILRIGVQQCWTPTRKLFVKRVEVTLSWCEVWRAWDEAEDTNL
jgi:hypothetical protein